MLGIPLGYLLKHPVEGMELASDPFEVWNRVQESYLAQREQRRPPCEYEHDENWERRLHERLGVAWPCNLTQEFWVLWHEVVSELEAKGVRPGPQSFGSWNDGDAGFVRAVWCLTRHLRPKNVVETGVARGVTSRFVLEALDRNRTGRLSSIDLPPIERFLQSQIGMAVGGRFADRWSYMKGSSRLLLPKLLSRLGEIDLFIHDSMHSEHNVRFEMDRALVYVRRGGAIVVDDIDASWGFRSFTERFPAHPSMICEAEPLRPDLRRFNKKGLFGIILKESSVRA